MFKIGAILFWVTMYPSGDNKGCDNVNKQQTGNGGPMERFRTDREYFSISV